MTRPYVIQPMDGIPLYDRHDTELGRLTQNIVTVSGERCYGILAFNCGDGRTFQIPVPWAIINVSDNTGRHFADIDHLKLMEAPRFRTSDVAGFDAEFASEVDAAYGLEFPGIESMNDMA